MKIIDAASAAELIEPGWCVAASGFGGFCHPEAITAQIEERFLKTGEPRNLTIIFSASTGDRKTRGMGHLAFEGLVSRVIAGGWRGTPRLGQLAREEKIEAYAWPQGVIAQLYRAIAAGQPGVLTRVGLGTFVDPRETGGRLNKRTTTDLVQVMDIRGKEYLLFHSIPIDCALLRGTTADEAGNITMEDEAFQLDALAMAQAAHNSGGRVVVQVKRVVPAGTLDPNLVRIPGMLVDYVVVCTRKDQHWVSYGEMDNDTYTERRSISALTPISASMSSDKIIQRRAFLELDGLSDPIINLGIGIPAGIVRIAHEEGKTDYHVTIESGVIGGFPAEELSFGAASYPDAIIPQASQFDFYDGGGLDVAFLGMAELDARGDVNVSRFGNNIVGVGGFINIAQNAKKLVFVGSLTAGGTQIEIADGKLHVRAEGSIRKVVDRVQQVSFNASDAFRSGRQVTYVTERAVFELRENGLVLTEIAPGVDLQRDILAVLPPAVTADQNVKAMDPRIFKEIPMTAGDVR
jgi:propionate CoA-transferase